MHACITTLRRDLFVDTDADAKMQMHKPLKIYDMFMVWGGQDRTMDGWNGLSSRGFFLVFYFYFYSLSVSVFFIMQVFLRSIFTLLLLLFLVRLKCLGRVVSVVWCMVT